MVLAAYVIIATLSCG